MQGKRTSQGRGRKELPAGSSALLRARCSNACKEWTIYLKILLAYAYFLQQKMISSSLLHSHEVCVTFIFFICYFKKS